jgi:hypothetical protein
MPNFLSYLLIFLIVGIERGYWRGIMTGKEVLRGVMILLPLTEDWGIITEKEVL